MTRKPRTKGPRPWWFNTYFIFGIVLFVVGVLGLIKGANFIMDPGQIVDVNKDVFDPPLPWIYLGAAVLFFINGYFSHKATLREHETEISEDA